ncbi:Uncharacterised protein [Candidatus Anstonella stagnisolia]|nr:Uncharacterised protein [Candidatus Anstonella stagnisolia]
MNKVVALKELSVDAVRKAEKKGTGQKLCTFGTARRGMSAANKLLESGKSVPAQASEPGQRAAETEGKFGLEEKRTIAEAYVTLYDAGRIPKNRKNDQMRAELDGALAGIAHEGDYSPIVEMQKDDGWWASAKNKVSEATPIVLKAGLPKEVAAEAGKI